LFRRSLLRRGLYHLFLDCRFTTLSPLLLATLGLGGGTLPFSPTIPIPKHLKCNHPIHGGSHDVGEDEGGIPRLLDGGKDPSHRTPEEEEDRDGGEGPCGSIPVVCPGLESLAHDDDGDDGGLELAEDGRGVSPEIRP